MNDKIKFTRKLLGALAVAVGLMFAAVIAWAAFPTAAPAENFATPRSNPSHLVIHGVSFDRNGKLTDGSKAVLDDAAATLKQEPNATVSVDQNRAADPDSACGLTPAQTEKIASYIEQRGVPATRLTLCEATSGSSLPAQE